MAKFGIKLFILLSFAWLTACTNMGAASKASTSLSSFLGFSELPDWYVKKKYSYPDSFYRENDFGLDIHYREAGEGPTVVLLHGELTSLHAWEAWFDILKQDFHVVAIDLPGAGLTGTPRCIDDPEDICASNITRDYLAHTFTYLLEDLSIDKFHLVGSSFGGYLSALYTINNPDRVESLTLISPLGLQQDVPFMVNYLTNANFITELVQPASVITTVIDDNFADPNKVTPETLKRTIHLAQTDGAHEGNIRFLTAVKELMQRGSTADFASIETKTLLMWGDTDKWGDARHGDTWNKMINESQLVEYDNVGHLSMIEHAEDSVYDFIAFVNDEPLPTIEGLGRDSFTMQEAIEGLDQESLFGPNAGELEEMDDNP